MKILGFLAALAAGIAGAEVGGPAVAESDVPPLPQTSLLIFSPAASADVADALQALIDANPNRTICIPDGTWLLSHPIATPAEPKLAVSLHLADFAILKAAPDFPAGKPLVRLGGTHPSRDIRAPGSVYGLYGGIIDGSGIADGVTIESGRETRVQNVSMKNVRIGLHVLHGANSGSADCDIRDVHVVGNRAPDSVGLFVEAHDNSFSNMRIYDCMTGVRIRAGGNRLINVHPLWSCPMERYDEGIGFDDGSAANTYVCSYADQYSTGWLFREKAGVSHMIQCTAFWYAPNSGLRHTAIRCEGPFRAICSAMTVSFRNGQATNTILVAAPGGSGVMRDTIFDEKLLNDPGDNFGEYRK
jgi:hypothetical protein